MLQIDAGVATTLASVPVAVSSGADYRLLLSVTGSSPVEPTRNLFAASDLVRPIATVRYTDSLSPTYGSGFTGLLVAGGDAASDGIGDARQCGDVDDNGGVDSADVVAYRDSLADPGALPLTPAGVAKCSAIESAGPCEILDVAVIQRALESEPLLPGIAQVCSAARGP